MLVARPRLPLCQRNIIPSVRWETSHAFGRPKRSQIKQWEAEQLQTGGYLPPRAPDIEPVQRQLLGESAVMTTTGWNRRPPTAKIIFYHSDLSPLSIKSSDLIQRIFKNSIGHLAPLKFILDVREEVPSAEAFRELVYLSGEASFRIFFSPHKLPEDHIPNGAALHNLISQHPQLLWWPIIHLTTMTGTHIFIGDGAVARVVKTLERERRRQIGPQVEKTLRRLTENDPESISKWKRYSRTK
ncbi:hypothetical protein C8R44DRAFT_109768 [Mycena epipterygia]|nr:hypothetical protein C8R44DRAFT_109768 [Mycena epipterygia]